MRSRLPMLLVGLLVIGGMVLLLSVGRGGQDRRVDRSVVGFALLAPWLESQGIAVEQSNPRLAPKVDSLSMRILPLQDMDIMAEIPVGLAPRERFYSDTLIDADYDNVVNKLYELPTLVVVPKWVAGTFVRKIAHRSVLIPLERYPDLLERLIASEGLRLIRPAPGLQTLGTKWGEVTLFEPQVFDPASLPQFCEPLLSLPAGPLAIACRNGELEMTFLLSDPDLLNNHGLTLGENGAVATRLIGATRTGDPLPVYLDTHDAIYTDYWTENDLDQQRRDYERDSDDFGRLLSPPLAALWAILFIVLGLCFWRGAVRFGPLLPSDKQGTEPSKTAAISTKARLLRLSGHDGQMVADYVRADLAGLARQIFGSAASQAGQARLFAHLARRDAEAAASLQQTAEALIARAPQMPHAELTRLLHTYRTLLERLTNGHDPDRVPKPR